MVLRRALAGLVPALLLPLALLAQAPNVVLVSLDTFRADKLAAWGGAPGLTPNLNALAAKGMTFTACFAPAPETLPSHATLLTGAYPDRTGLHDNGLGRLASGVPTLAEALSAHGYTTAAVIASPVLGARYGLAKGFMHYDDMLGTSGSRPAGEITDRALALLKEPRKGPLFLWVHYFDTHFPYATPDAFARGMKAPPYETAAAYVDSEAGRLLSALPANTVVAVVSDHGEALGEHGEPTHGVFLFQPTIHAVCLLSGPGVPPGRSSAVPCSLADVASSLCALAKVPGSGLRSQGQDLMTLSKASDAPSRALPLEAWLPFAQFRWMPLLGVTDGRYKWVRGKTDRLFDLDSDPGETKDLSASAPPEALALRAGLPSLPANPPTEGSVVDPVLLGLGYAPAPGGRLDPASLPDPHDRAGVLQDIMQARLERSLGQFDKAVPRLRAVTASDPGNPSAWYEFGETLRQAEKTGEALTALDRALAISSQLPEAWAAKGHVLVAQEKNGEAARCYEKALAVQPDFTGALNPLAAYYLDGNKPERALPLLERAVSSGFADEGTFLLRGRVRLVQSRPAEAARDFEAALHLSADPRQTLKAEADIYMVRKRYEEGLSLYEEGIKRYPRFAPNYLTMGSYFLQADQPARAYPLFKGALACDLDPKIREHVEGLVKDLGEMLGSGETE